MTPLSPTPLTDERLTDLLAWHRATDGHTRNDGCPGCDTQAALRELQQARRSLAERDADIGALESYIGTLEARNAELVGALTKLTNEADGCVEMARECIGNTNANVLKLRISEARAALTEQQGGK